MDNDPEIYKQLGNAVNVKIIKVLSKKLFGFEMRDNK